MKWAFVNSPYVHLTQPRHTPHRRNPTRHGTHQQEGERERERDRAAWIVISFTGRAPREVQSAAACCALTGGLRSRRSRVGGVDPVDFPKGHFTNHMGPQLPKDTRGHGGSPRQPLLQEPSQGGGLEQGGHLSEPSRRVGLHVDRHEAAQAAVCYQSPCVLAFPPPPSMADPLPTRHVVVFSLAFWVVGGGPSWIKRTSIRPARAVLGARGRRATAPGPKA